MFIYSLFNDLYFISAYSINCLMSHSTSLLLLCNTETFYVAEQAKFMERLLSCYIRLFLEIFLSCSNIHCEESFTNCVFGFYRGTCLSVCLAGFDRSMYVFADQFLFQSFATFYGWLYFFLFSTWLHVLLGCALLL